MSLRGSDVCLILVRVLYSPITKIQILNLKIKNKKNPDYKLIFFFFRLAGRDHLSACCGVFYHRLRL